MEDRARHGLFVKAPQVFQGTTAPATEWLRDNLQTHGGLRKPADTIAHACGAAPSEAPLLAYLDQKFSDLYAL